MKIDLFYKYAKKHPESMKILKVIIVVFSKNMANQAVTDSKIVLIPKFIKNTLHDHNVVSESFSTFVG